MHCWRTHHDCPPRWNSVACTQRRRMQKALDFLNSRHHEPKSVFIQTWPQCTFEFNVLQGLPKNPGHDVGYPCYLQRDLHEQRMHRGGGVSFISPWEAEVKWRSVSFTFVVKMITSTVRYIFSLVDYAFGHPCREHKSSYLHNRIWSVRVPQLCHYHSAALTAIPWSLLPRVNFLTVQFASYSLAR